MEHIYLTAASESGSLRCVIDADDRTIWMYLHDLAKNGVVVGDAPLCSLVPLITLAEFKRTYARGNSPPLVAEYSSDRAEIAGITANRIAIRWAPDGQSVAAFVDGEPFAMILAGEKKGYSKATSEPGPWGRPWRDDLFWLHFGKPPIAGDGDKPHA